MTDFETIARQRLNVVSFPGPAERSVRQSIKITERLIYAVSLMAVVVGVWLFACFAQSWS